MWFEFNTINVEDGDEKRCDNRANNKSHDSNHADSTKSGKENEEIMEPGASAYQARLKYIIYAAYDNCWD